MKHILYIISVFCLFNATLFGQNQVADTTDLKLISNINKGKVVTVTSTAYQGDYTATNVEQTPNASTIFASSVRNGWYWVKVQDALKLSTSDTASMLLSYIKRGDTASMLTPYINRADTAAAFTPFIERSDTAAMLDGYARQKSFIDSIADLRSDLGTAGLTITQAKADGDLRNPQTLGNYNIIGRNWLISNAKFLYEFDCSTCLTYGSALDTVIDLTGNGWNLGTRGGLFNPPRYGATLNENNTIDDFIIVRSSSLNKEHYVTQIAGDSLYDSDFEVHALIQPYGDFSQWFLGQTQGTNRAFIIRIKNGTGKLQVVMDFNTGGLSYYESTKAVSNDNTTATAGSSDPFYIRVRVDFTNDTLRMWKNSEEIPMELVIGNGMSPETPGLNFATTGFGVGAAAKPTSPYSENSDDVAMKIWKVAFTSVLSDSIARNVAAYFTNQPDLIVGLPYYSPVEKLGKVDSLMIQLYEQPTDDVTVSISGNHTTNNGPFVFTTSNWETPQKVKFTGINTNSNNGYEIDTIIVSAKGGGYNKSREIYIPIADQNSDYRFFQAIPSVHSSIVQLGRNPDTLRYWLRDSIFKDSPFGQYPVFSNLDSSVINYTGALHKINKSSLDVPTTIDKLIFSSVDRLGYDWINRAFLIKRTDQVNDKLAFVVCGHGSELGQTEIANKFLLNGFDVLELSMPVTNKNTENNPLISGTGVNAHNDISGQNVDDNDTIHLYLFYENLIEALNYIDSIDSYGQYGITGVSGGGLMAMFASAMDNRFTATGMERSISLPNFIFNDVDDGDYEQAGYVEPQRQRWFNGNASQGITNIYKDLATYTDLLILTGEAERELYQRHSVFDNCCHEGSEFKILEPWLNNYIDRYTLKFDRDTINYSHLYDSISIAGTVETFLRGRVNLSRGKYYSKIELNDTLSYYSLKDGWAHYIDTAYANAADSFYVAQGSTLTLPIKANMADGLVTSYLPNGVDSLFSQHDSTILGIAVAATYTVRISFKAKNSNNTGYATIAFDIGTGGTPNIASSETFIFPKGAGVETQESKTVLLYSLDTFVANGCKIKVTADTGNLEIYDIRLLIRLDSRP